MGSFEEKNMIGGALVRAALETLGSTKFKLHRVWHRVPTHVSLVYGGGGHSVPACWFRKGYSCCCMVPASLDYGVGKHVGFGRQH